MGMKKLTPPGHTYGGDRLFNVVTLLSYFDMTAVMESQRR